MTAEDQHSGIFEPISEEEEIILLLNHDNPTQAAARIRQLKSAGRELLEALADMIGGDPKAQPELVELYSYRLKLSSWGLPGRKPKSLKVKAKGNTGYQPKKPINSEKLGIDGTHSEIVADQPKHLSAAPAGVPKTVSDAMLMAKVRGRIGMGISRANAIAEVAKGDNVSTSKVEKAYDCRASIKVRLSVNLDETAPCVACRREAPSSQGSLPV